MTTIKQALLDAQAALRAVTDVPTLEADILLAYVLNKPRSYLYAWPEADLAAAQYEEFNLFINRRLQHEPIAYLTGRRECWSLEFLVTPDTLIPRSETELLIETVLGLFPDSKQALTIADLGTGSGTIALSIAHERPKWHIDATDTSKKALAVASKNAQRFNLKNVTFAHGDWCAALPAVKYDAIVSNPPYIAETEWSLYAAGLQFEPRQALVSGVDGLDAIREISRTAKLYLKPNGHLLIEHGFKQAHLVRSIFLAEGYDEVRSLCDVAGHERITVGIFKR